MIQAGQRLRLIAAISSASVLSACAIDGPTLRPTTPAAAPSSAPIATDALVGRWGVGAYHRDADRARTEKEARAQCGNPYVIKAGATGGVMMHLADEKEPFELRVRSGPNERIILGPDGAPDNYNDREISGFDGKTFTTAWLDSEIAGRYGKTIYVRCGAAAAPRAAAGKRT